MIRELYTLFDKKSNTFFDNFFSANNSEEVKRTIFNASINNNYLMSFSSDYDIYRVATFNCDNCDVVPDKKFIINLNTLIYELRKGATDVRRKEDKQ